MCVQTFGRLNSVTRLGNFGKFQAANFLITGAQIFGNFLGYFEVCHFILKRNFAYFCGQYLKIWVNFQSHCC